MLLSFILLILVAICTAMRYDNFTLFRGTPSKKKHLQFLQSLKDTDFNVNFWTELGSLGKPVQFSIPPDLKDLFLEEAKRIRMPVKVIQADIQKLFDAENKQFYSRTDNEFGWESYYNVDTIYAWMKELARTRAPEILVQKIGTTYENREILAAIVCLKGSLRRSKVIVEGGIHAREWISPAFVTYMLNQILNARSEDEELMLIAMTYEWYFIPILNPDGYDYSHKTDRMWTKNRNGPGVDINRNFSFKFGAVDNSTTKPQHETWYGLNAFSENESITLSNYVKYVGEGLEYYLSIHSFGQYMIIPYGYTEQHLDNYNDVRHMALRAADVIKFVHKTTYQVGTASETVGYKQSGTSTDWIKQAYKVPYVLSFKLRDQGYYGFALPANLIVPTCAETLTGLLNILDPKTESFSEVKKKYDASVEKYRAIDHITSGCPVFYKSFIVFMVFFCIKLL